MPDYHLLARGKIAPQKLKEVRWIWIPHVVREFVQPVEQAVELYRELLVEIATLARLKYGGYAKGRGASYAEGFVAGLLAILRGFDHPAIIESSRALKARHERDAKVWLKVECNISLVKQSSSSRSGYDPGAAAVGRADGKTRHVTRPGQLRLN